MKHEAINSAAETPNYIAWDKLSEDNESFKTDFEETPIENDFAEEFETKTPEVEMTEDNTEAIETEPETTTNSIEQSSSPETETKIEPLQADIDAIERYGKDALVGVIKRWEKTLEAQKSQLDTKREIADKALAEVEEIQAEYDKTNLSIAQLQAAIDFTDQQKAEKAAQKSDEAEEPRYLTGKISDEIKRNYELPNGVTLRNVTAKEAHENLVEYQS